MSSRCSEGRTRPKSPLPALHPESSTRARTAARPGYRGSNFIQLKHYLCASRPRAAFPPAAWCAAAAALEPVGGFVGMTFDTHHRKDDHARRLRIGTDVTATTQRTHSFWKLDYDSHVPLPPPARSGFLPHRRFGQVRLRGLHG